MDRLRYLYPSKSSVSVPVSAVAEAEADGWASLEETVTLPGSRVLLYKPPGSQERPLVVLGSSTGSEWLPAIAHALGNRGRRARKRHVSVSALVATSDIAKRLGTEPYVIREWADTYSTFPSPIARVANVYVFDWDQVRAWVQVKKPKFLDRL